MILDLRRSPPPSSAAQHLARALEGAWIAYQPIVDVLSGKVRAHEALLRTTDRDLATPRDVLRAADRLGKEWDVGRHVRRLAAGDAQSLPSGQLLFVNVHARDLVDPDLLLDDAPLARHACRIVLEINERLQVDRIPDLEARVARLRSRGYRIAIDDAGAGEHAMASLPRLRPEFVKIDMTLVRHVQASRLQQALVRSIVDASDALGVIPIAEGVETERERDRLLELGCHIMQGYLFGAPRHGFTARVD